MNAEIEQQVYDGEVVEDEFPYELESYEDHENAMVTERQGEDKHRWRQCRIAASAVGRFKQNLVRKLANTAGLSPQAIYDYARAYNNRQQLNELAESAAEGSEDSGQPETLAPTHHVEISYAPEEDRPALAREAEDGGYSSQRIRHRAGQLRQQKAERENGKPETVQTPECPTCGAEPDHWQRPPVGSRRPPQPAVHADESRLYLSFGPSDARGVDAVVPGRVIPVAPGVFLELDAQGGVWGLQVQGADAAVAERLEAEGVVMNGS